MNSSQSFESSMRPALRGLARPTVESRPISWETVFTWRLQLGDLLVVFVTMLFTQLLWFGPTSFAWRRDPGEFDSAGIPPTLLSFVVLVLWEASLSAFGSHRAQAA